MQNDNFSFEIIDRLRLSFSVDENHTLTEVVSLELLLLNLSLDCETDSLACDGLFNVDSLVMDTLDLDGVELALLVRS